jgi:predicted membrane chloride channel (bestrophin family)
MWSAFVSTLNLILTAKWNVQLKLSSIPHSLLVSSLALLLVFRTNSAYQRFAEGRKIWEKILSVSRNMSRMATLYRKELGNPRLNRILRLLAVFPYLLRNHVKPQIVKDETINDGVMREQGKESINGSPQQTNQVLPWSLLPPTALAKCTSALNRPLWICDALSHEINQVQYTDNFTSRERLTFLSLISKLSDAVGECERIHQTAVPLNYARHSLRSLTFWLLTLPICLVGELGLLTAPVMGAIAWIMLGVYQIGYTIEDPFQGSLRLRVLCDAIYRNVMCDQKGNLVNRKSAFEMNDEEVSEWRELPPEPEVTPQQEESW